MPKQKNSSVVRILCLRTAPPSGEEKLVLENRYYLAGYPPNTVFAYTEIDPDTAEEHDFWCLGSLAYEEHPSVRLETEPLPMRAMRRGIPHFVIRHEGEEIKILKIKSVNVEYEEFEPLPYREASRS